MSGESGSQPHAGADLRALVPDIGEEALRAAMAEAARLPQLHRALAQLRRHGQDVGQRLRLRDDAGLAARTSARAPTVLISWHFGLVRHLGPGLAPLGLDLLVFRNRPTLAGLPVPSYREVMLGRRPTDRAVAVAVAVEHLRAGGSVLLLADGPGHPRLRVPCLGRRVGLARGPFALARLTGALVVPVAAVASGDGVEVVVESPLAAAAGAAADAIELELATAAGHRLEALVRRHPGQVHRTLLDRLLRSRSLGTRR
jgi:hypothetical protein